MMADQADTASHQPSPVEPSVGPPERPGEDVNATTSVGSVRFNLKESLIVQRSLTPFQKRLLAGLTKVAVMLYRILTNLMMSVGIALVGLGLVSLVDERRGLVAGTAMCCGGNLPPLTTILPFLRDLSLMMVMAGWVTILLAVMGCCGLLLRSKVLMGFFGFFLTLVVLGQLSFGADAFFRRDTLRCRLREALVKVIEDHYEGSPNSSSPFSQAVDSAQLTLGCCGVDGPWDFNNTPWFRQRSSDNLTLPWTCCQMQPEMDMTCPAENPLAFAQEDCPFLPPGPDNPYSTLPCLPLMEERIMQHFMLLLWLLLSLTLLEMVAMGSTALAITSLRSRTGGCCGQAADLDSD